MCKWIVNVFRGQWHKFAGHPPGAVEVVWGGEAGIRVATFRCKKCARSFDKQLPTPR